ncbi:MAG: hypothetical protein NT020_08155 [Chloroflexales bacterium]|nr:hypothetical protein [Chloroflexales bacterium]
MHRNTDSDFVGILALTRTHHNQVAAFRRWAGRGDWSKFHYEHYDWWAFPISKKSTYGSKYVVFSGDVAVLNANPQFVTDYVDGVQLGAAAWGWDVHAGASIADPAPGQAWADWPIRLSKMLRSTAYFGQRALAQSLRHYGQSLIAQGTSLMYKGKDLRGEFA